MNFPESLNTDYTSLNITLVAASHVIPLRDLYFTKRRNGLSKCVRIIARRIDVFTTATIYRLTRK